MISVEAEKIGKLYLGDTEIKKAYVGENLVFTSKDKNKLTDWLPGNINSNYLVGSSCICYGAGKFVACMYGNPGSYGSYYSTDGISWSYISFGVRGNWRGIAYYNDKFVAVDYNKNVVYSTNGTSWTSGTIKIAVPTCISAGNGKFVVGGNSTYGAYSSDGTKWSTSTGLGFKYKNSIVFDGAKFVSLQYGYLVQTSFDGTTWTTVCDLRNTFGSNASFDNIAYGKGLFVATKNIYGQDKDSVVVSSDCINWELVPIPVSGDHGTAYGNGKFVIVTSGSDVAAYSIDGFTWETSLLPSASDWKCVAYGGDKFVAFAEENNVAAYCIDPAA